MLSSASGTTLHKNFPVQCCPRRSYSWGNIAQIKTLCSVVFQAPDNNAQEKILFYVVLILLGQHYIGKNPMQCWTWGSRQQCTGKNLVQCCLNTLGTTWRRSKPSAMLSERLQTTLHRKNPVQNPVQSFLHIHGITWYRKSLCNIVPEAPFHRQQTTLLHCSRQHCTGKNPGNVFWTTSGHSAYKYSSGPSCQKKKEKLSFLYCENRLTS